MRREIVLLGDEVLRRKAKPVAKVDASIRRLIDDMIESMDQANGVGLAAPQLGVSKRVLVATDDDGRPVVLVNPVMKRSSGRETGTEGCLSMPGVYGEVPRAKRVQMTGLDRAGRTVTVDADGFLARVLQHELDHLNGVLFTDHTKDLWWHELVEVTELDPAERAELDDEDLDEEDMVVRRLPTNHDEIKQRFDELRRQRREMSTSS